MIPWLLAGAGIGLGALVLIRSLVPARPDLVTALDRLNRPPSLALPDSPDARPVLVGLANALGLDRLISVQVATDLRLLGRTRQSHLARCVITAFESALTVPAFVAVLALAGYSPPLQVPLVVLVLGAVGGALLPNIVLRGEATARRRGFNHALSAFLDLVAVNLAAGRGVEGALDTAAATGHGWAFDEIRQALYRAKVLGQTPWTGLDRLGEELGAVDLRELAASVSLAGDNGAKVRTSLAAKAQALRIKGLADVEEAAQAATERMSLPVILLLCGFVLFIGYPAVDRVLNGI